MSTLAQLGLGLQFKLETTASPQAFTLIGEVKNVSGFGKKRPLVEATHYQSTIKEWIGGIPDGVEFNVVANYIPDNVGQLAMIAAVDQAAKPAQLIEPATMDSGTWDLDALVTGFELSPPLDGVFTATWTVKITGSLVYTP